MKYKNVLIMGYKTSGQYVEKILLDKKISYMVYDKKYVKSGGKFLNKLKKDTLVNFDLAIVSPGISVYDKDMVKIKSLGIKVVGETEFSSWYIKTPIISVTGTNGKTTTTELITHILKDKYSVKALGNIGKPLSSAVGDNKLDYIVNEISSFQLESISTYSPKIRVLLNIDEDHLEWHKTKENYINAKLKLFETNSTKTISIVNKDDSNIKGVVSSIKGRVYTMSLVDLDSSIYADDSYIYYTYKTKGKIALQDIKVNTNIYNVMASVFVSKILGLDDKTIINRLNTFKVSSHRMELVKKINGITIINDSTLNALRLIMGNSVVLLLGGYDKKLDFSEIFKVFGTKLKCVVAFGKCRNKVTKCAYKNGYKNVIKCKKFDDAVKEAYGVCTKGDTLLLSPATSSFDEFGSFIERGERFKIIISKVENFAKNK